MRTFFAALLLIFALIPTNSYAREKITGVYTDMHYVGEEGDFVGTEITVTYSNQGFYVLFQIAEGEPSPPVLVKAKVEKDKVEFTLPEGKFSGRISKGILKGKLEGNGEFTLKRGQSIWQK